LKQARSTTLLAPPVLPPLDRLALFADLDGTLAPIEATPEAVGPDAARRRLIDGLIAALSGRFAVVSGRRLADIDRVLEGRVAAVAGAHGLERRDSAGRIITVCAGPAILDALALLHAFAETRSGLIVEDKGRLAVALHFRLSPAERGACRIVAQSLARDLGLEVQEGDMVVELRVPGPDKGGAVRAFMAEPPFAGHIPVFIGDDLTDERGFEAAAVLGGFGVIVGARRPTTADYAVADVAAAMRWLNEAFAAPRGNQRRTRSL